MTPLRPGHAKATDKLQGNFYLKTYRLIAPDLYALNYMSLINLDADEADSLGMLIYEKN